MANARSTAHNGRAVRTTTTEEVDDGVVARNRGQLFLTNIIWFAAGVIIVLLGFRFVFALLGANPSNSFAHFIYQVSHPFVAPFFGLFSYNYSYGISRFEAYTLVAMLVYLIIAWGLSALINLNRR